MTIVSRSVDARYRGQAHQITIPVTEQPLTDVTPEEREQPLADADPLERDQPVEDDPTPEEDATGGERVDEDVPVEDPDGSTELDEDLDAAPEATPLPENPPL